MLGLAIILLTNVTVLSTIFDEWNSNGPYSHGFLGFAVVLYVLWLQRYCFLNVRHTPSFIAAILLLICCLGLLVAYLASVQQLQQLMLFVVIVFYTTSIYGFSILKKLFFPILMLALILPIWNVFQMPLRELSTLVGEVGPRLWGIEVERDNYNLSTFGGVFAVEEACSGLGFFMVAALFAACVSFFNNLGLTKSIKFLLICLSFSLLANWLRITIIIIVGSYTHMQHFVVQDHLTFGWAVFSVFLVPLIYLSRHYFGVEEKEEVFTEKTIKDISVINKPHLFITYVILISFICALYWIPSRYDEHYRFKLPAFKDYQLVSINKLSSPNWSPILHGVSSESFNFVVKGELGIQVYLANYIKQSQASEMIYVENRLYNENRWSLVEKSQADIETNQLNRQVNLLYLSRGQGRSRLIAYWYVVNGVHTENKKRAKLEEMRSAIIGKPGATLIAFSIDYRTLDEANTRQQMFDFIQEFFTKIEQ